MGGGGKKAPSTIFPPSGPNAGRSSVFHWFSIEPTVPIVNQELREIFKIKSETTGYVQEGDDYAWEFLSVTAVPLCLFTLGEKWSFEIHDQNKHTGSCAGMGERASRAGRGGRQRAVAVSTAK